MIKTEKKTGKLLININDHQSRMDGTFLFSVKLFNFVPRRFLSEQFVWSFWPVKPNQVYVRILNFILTNFKIQTNLFVHTLANYVE